MAAVLEEFLSGKISSKSLVSWLSSNDYVDDAGNELYKHRSLRAEFLPFFINYLRDQTSHLVCHGGLLGASPAKTPASAQKFRRSSLQQQTSETQQQEVSNRGTQRRPNRTQLFSPSPSSLRSDNSEGALTPKSQKSEEESPLRSSTEVHSWEQPGQFYLKTPNNEYKGRAKKVSPSFHKKEDPVTLGEYIRPDGVNPNQSKGRRRSDQYYQKENASHKTPVNSKRRSGGKGNKMSYSDGSLKSKSRHVYQDQPTPEFVLNDSEDFPAVGTPSPASNIPSRRITPTALTTHRKALTSRGKQQCQSTTVFSKSYQEEPSSIPHSKFQTGPSATGSDRATQDSPSQSGRGLEKERELLRLERLKQANGSDSTSIPLSGSSPRRPQTPTKTRSSSISSAFCYPSEWIKASKNEVTYLDYVNKLAEIYSACTKECLMPNLTIELYFLVHLLTAKGSVSSTDDVNQRSDPEDINYLCSIHNCVQFAISVLQELFWLLTFLDKTTLKLLADVPHLSDFNPALKAQLELTIDGSSSRPVIVTTKSPVQAVPFMADTDNRSNFPSETAFHSFKKQRDKFYELVREWLDYHNKPGWSMRAAMSKRIRDLVQHVVEVANCTHFARLFSSQLTRMCQGDHLISDHKEDGKERGFLGNLRKTNPEKFKRLEERFFTPTTSGGPSPPPAFHGCQEFFKEFIVAADSFLFNQHLIDHFSSKILEINDMQFGISDQDGDPESKGVDDEEVRSSFNSSLQAVRVLAKFLGFLVFLPYQGGDILPDMVQADMIALRNKLSPPVDILEKLRTSLCQHRLVITVPWVVEYLSMMDPMAAQLESFQVLLRLLVQVYRNVSRKLCSDPASYNMLLVLLVLGWLFEIPGVPASMYFVSFADDFDLDEPGMMQTLPVASLDNHHLVDQQLLYLCCPYLGDIRVLLSDASMGLGSKTTPMKKITPIAAKPPSKPIQTVQQLQQDLEKNFFDNHSPSLRKTVDFVSSRLASNCIKHIDATLIPASRETTMGLLEEEIRSEEVGSDEEWTSEMKRAVLRRVKVRAEEVSLATREAAEEQAREFILRRSRDALSLLLPQETSDQVLEAAAHITSRLATERARRWISTQIQAAIQQDLNTSIDKAIRTTRKESVEKPTFSLPVIHDRSLASPSAVLQQYKDILRYLLSWSTVGKVTLQELVHLLIVTRKVLHSRQDLTPVACLMIQELSHELVSALAVFKPSYLYSVIPCETLGLSLLEEGEGQLMSTGDGTQPSKHSQRTVLGDGCSKTTADSRCPTPGEAVNLKSSRSKESSTLAAELRRASPPHSDDLTTVQEGITKAGESLKSLPGQQPVGNGVAPELPSIQADRIREVWTTERSEKSVNREASEDQCLVEEVRLSLQTDRRSCIRISSGSLYLVDAFVCLWRDCFKCQVPVRLFLCPRNALMIDHTGHPKECWDTVMYIIHALTVHKLTDLTEVVQCLLELLRSEYVHVTEALTSAAWSVMQVLIEDGHHDNQISSLSDDGCENDMMTSLLQVLLTRCP